MAFPTIPTVADGRILFTLNTAGGATKTFPNLSSLTKNPGDLLIAIIIEYDGNSTNAEFSSWGGSFTEFADFAGTATMAIGAAYKWSTGSETGTFTVTTADTSTNDSVLILMSIPGAHASTPPEAGGFATATNASANPAAFNPSGWDAEDTLWIAVGGSGEDSTTGSFTGLATPPANYGSDAQSGITADAVGGVEAGVAFRQLNAASEDVANWSQDTTNIRSSALVIAVRPVTVVTETPTFGGGTAQGVTPTPLVGVAAQGASGQGVTPTPNAPLAIAGSAAAGTEPTAVVTVAIGGAIAGGVAPPEPVTETPTFGGAIAQGVAPTATVSAIAQGALVSGTSPTAVAPLSAGGVTGSGTSPTSSTSLTSAGAVAAGISAAPYATASVAGAVAQGQAPGAGVPPAQGGVDGSGIGATALIPFVSQGADAAGLAPAENIGGGGITETPTFGGAVAGGSGPASSAVSGQGGSSAGDFAASATITLSAHGAIAGGAGPSSSAVAGQGGSTASDFSVASAVFVSPGAAVSGGNAPSVPLSETPDFGGALAGGSPPGTASTVAPGGVVTTGAAGAPTITLAIGGAIAGGFAISEIGTQIPGIAVGGDRSASAVSGGDFVRGHARGGDRNRQYATGGDRRS